MGYWQLAKKHPRSLGFGFIHTFFSGLGQTHFVALYSPIIMSQFELSATQYGSLYSILTLISGLFISFIGPLIDKKEARMMALLIGVGLLFSQSLLMSLTNLWIVAIGLFGLRLFGQGLSSSLSSITVARFFTDQRGKALSLSQLGYPCFEGLITPLGAIVLTSWGLSSLSFIILFVIAFLFIPATILMTKNLPEFNLPRLSNSTGSSEKVNSSGWSRKEVFTNKTIYFLLPQTLMPPFALTGVFFHQAIIAEQKTWSLSLMATGLSFFALGRILNTFVTGPMVDKYKAINLFPFYQIPLSISFLILAVTNHTWGPALCFFLFGLTVGSGGPIKSAIWAELYGVKHLGAIKSALATLMIFSTAASPALFGWIIDKMQSSSALLLGLAGSSFIFAILSFVGLKSIQKK